jgi:NADH:ubiquinone oxidoreductase subunit 5 (subunit L)/multisubunit Na+/H+ antiporter MnhA subunit
MVELIKNPITIGFLAGFITYFYLVWDKRKEIERAKKSKKNKKVDKKVDLLIPGLVAVVVWFISYLYLNQKQTSMSQMTSNQNINNNVANNTNVPKTYNLVSESNTDEEFGKENQLSYTLITNNKGITLPDGLHANMFIEKI